MRRAIGAALIAIGAALIGWAVFAPSQNVAHYTVTIAPASADAELEGLGLPPQALRRVEVRSGETPRTVASGVALATGEGLTPLAWRNEATQPIFFMDAPAADVAKVMRAIRDNVPEGAVVLAWWDLSRVIRATTKRDAPLDDPAARGLLLPASWSEAPAAESARWGAGAASPSNDRFDRFVDALLGDEAQGAQALATLFEGKPAYIAVHISDVWKAAAARPDRLSVAYKDFASAGLSHGVIKSATQWMREQKIDGGFAAEPIDGATRLHFFARKGDSDALVAKLLPFSTSNPARLEKFELVFQHKGWWIYRLRT